MFLRKKLNIDCDKVFEQVQALKGDWIPRHLPGFYTLGRCAYLDLGNSSYYDGAKALNPALRRAFGNVYDQVSSYLSELLGEKVKLHENLAHPSFHIFEANEDLVGKGGTWHQDRPHVTLGLGETDYGTFTLPIKLPESGGGIEYLDGEDAVYFGYKPGEIVVHSGMVYHRIAPLKEAVEGEYRVTLQGHLIRQDGVMYMYW